MGAAQNKPAETGGTEAKPETAAAPEAPKVDPFANLPTVKLGETTAVDLAAAKVPQGPVRKYAKVDETARTSKSPMMIGWKHERAVFVPGTNRKELRATSVHGTIAAIVATAGRAGINAIDLVTQLRQRQVGNKRSIYCQDGSAGALPAVGWAEGWINSAVTRNIVGVHATRQAPALRAEPAPAAEGEGGAAKTGTDG